MRIITLILLLLILAGCAARPVPVATPDDAVAHNAAPLVAPTTELDELRREKKQWFITYSAVNAALPDPRVSDQKVADAVVKALPPDSKWRDMFATLSAFVAVALLSAWRNRSQIREMLALLTPSPIQQPQTTVVVTEPDSVTIPGVK